MNKIKIISVILLILTSSMIIYIDNAKSDGISVMPGQINIGDVLKGANYTRQIRIINSGQNPIGITLSSQGYFSSYVTFCKDRDFSQSINYLNVSKKEVVFIRFSIPKTIPTGIFNTTVYVKTAKLNDKETNNTSTSTIHLSFPIKITFKVTGEQILSGEITTMEIENTEVGYPVFIRIGFLNNGNVIAIPLIDINISREKWPLDNIKYSQSWIESGAGDLISIEWDTTNRDPGYYDARVRIILGDQTIEDKNLTFQLFPRGTFSRKGEILNLSCEGKLEIGKIIRIKALFQNTGNIEMQARLICEVHRDNELFKIIESKDEITVKMGETYEFNEFLEVKESGKYGIECYIDYGTNKTNIKSLSFEVGLGKTDIIPIGLALFASISICILLYIIYIKRRKENMGQN